MSQERREPPKSAPEVMRRIMDAQGEIDRLNATIAGLQAAVKEQTAKVQERDKEIERLRAALGEAYVNVGDIYGAKPSEVEGLVIAARNKISEVLALKGAE